MSPGAGPIPNATQADRPPARPGYWAKVLTDLVLSGEWSEMTNAERALIVPILVNTFNDTGECRRDSITLRSMAGLCRRAAQQAVRGLVGRGRIGRRWDGDHTHAADTIIRQVTRPARDWRTARKVAHRDALAHDDALGGSAPGCARVAHGDAPTSAPACARVAHRDAPPPIDCPIDHQAIDSPIDQGAAGAASGSGGVSAERLPGGKKTRGGKAADDVVGIPPSLDTPDFRAVWAEWQQQRREMRKKLTPTSARRQLEEAAELGPVIAADKIRAAIAGGWLRWNFEDKRTTNPRTTNANGRKRTAAERGEFAEDTIDLHVVDFAGSGGARH